MAEIDYSQYGDISGIKRRRALADTLMSGALGGQMGIPQQSGRIASAAGIGAALAPMLQAYVASKLNKGADEAEDAAHKAYRADIENSTQQGLQALKGAPAQIGVRPTNNPMPMLTGNGGNYVDQLLGGLIDVETKPAVAPDPMKAAELLSRNPRMKPYADELMKQLAAAYAPQDPSKLLEITPGKALAGALGNQPLTMANYGQVLGQALAGGGMPKIEGDRTIDRGTGAITNLPMTENQRAGADYNAGMLGYNRANLQRQYAELKQRERLANQDAELRRQSLAVQAMQASPEHAASVEAARFGAKLAAEKGAASRTKVENAFSALDLLGKIKDIIPRSTNSIPEKGLKALGAVFGIDSDARAADTELETVGSQLARFAERDPGMQTDKDFVNMKTQMGVVTGLLSTESQKRAAADAAESSMKNLIMKYGTPQERAQVLQGMRPQQGGTAGWGIERVD